MSKTIEILRFLKISPDGKKMMRIRGELYASVDEIPDERVQRVIRKTIADMVHMAGGVEKMVEDGLLDGLPILAAPGPEPIVDQKTAVDTEPVEPKGVASNLPLTTPITTPKEATRPTEPALQKKSAEEEATAEQKAFLEALRNQSFASAEPEPAKPERSLLGRLRGITNRPTAESEELMPKLNIGGQINTILQNKITKVPTFSGRHIELRSKLRGELEFIIDGRSYDAVGEIPDDEVKELFRSAITEWEKN